MATSPHDPSSAPRPHRGGRQAASPTRSPSRGTGAQPPSPGRQRTARRSAHTGDVALLERVRQRLGIAAPLTYQHVCVPLAELLVRDATPAMRRDAHLLAANMKLVGLLNPPSVLPLPIPSTSTRPAGGDVRYEVFLGRRRVLAAQELAHEHHLPDWERLTCHVYDLPQDPVLARRMRALLTLSENGCRSPAWVEELRRLVEFLDHPVPLTDKELWTALGISPAEVKARLKLARLPRPILDRVFAGDITSQALLHRIARLTHDQQAALAAQAVGTPLTATMIDQALRGQIDAGLEVPVLQASLGQGWERNPQPPRTGHAPSTSSPESGNAESAASLSRQPVAPTEPREMSNCGTDEPIVPHGADTLAAVVRLLRVLLPELAREARFNHACLLAEALLHEFEPEAQREHPVSCAA